MFCAKRFFSEPLSLFTSQLWASYLWRINWLFRNAILLNCRLKCLSVAPIVCELLKVFLLLSPRGAEVARAGAFVRGRHCLVRLAARLQGFFTDKKCKLHNHKRRVIPPIFKLRVVTNTFTETFQSNFILVTQVFFIISWQVSEYSSFFFNFTVPNRLHFCTLPNNSDKILKKSERLDLSTGKRSLESHHWFC